MRMTMMFALAMMVPVSATAQSDTRHVDEAPVVDPVTGYRVSHYRGVVGSVPEGVARVDVAQARALWRAGAIFIDVNPAPGAQRDAKNGRWALAELHSSIPRAHWFAESGRGAIQRDVERAFVVGVRRLAARHPNRPIIVFCQADCWMSWNAALRLHRAGLPDIRWFADGLDGWKDAGWGVKPVVQER